MEKLSKAVSRHVAIDCRDTGREAGKGRQSDGRRNMTNFHFPVEFPFLSAFAEPSNGGGCFIARIPGSVPGYLLLPCNLLLHTFSLSLSCKGSRVILAEQIASCSAGESLSFQQKVAESNRSKGTDTWSRKERVNR